MATHVPRVYLAERLVVGDAFALPRAKQHHVATVLRRQCGDTLKLFNDSGYEFDARVVEASRKTLGVQVTGCAQPRRESPLDITLVQAIASGERMDYALAKAVELGVDRIRPVFAEAGRVKLAGERLAKKHRHWQAVVESAAEQSGRLICSPVDAPMNLTDAVAERAPEAVGVALALVGDASIGVFVGASHVELLVGPESGLTAREIEAAQAHGWRTVPFGPRVLRTETAGPAAISALQTLAGDLVGAPPAGATA